MSVETVETAGTVEASESDADTSNGKARSRSKATLERDANALQAITDRGVDGLTRYELSEVLTTPERYVSPQDAYMSAGRLREQGLIEHTERRGGSWVTVDHIDEANAIVKEYQASKSRHEDLSKDRKLNRATEAFEKAKKALENAKAEADAKKLAEQVKTEQAQEIAQTQTPQTVEDAQAEVSVPEFSG